MLIGCSCGDFGGENFEFSVLMVVFFFILPVSDY